MWPHPPCSLSTAILEWKAKYLQVFHYVRHIQASCFFPPRSDWKRARLVSICFGYILVQLGAKICRIWSLLSRNTQAVSGTTKTVFIRCEAGICAGGPRVPLWVKCASSQCQGDPDHSLWWPRSITIVVNKEVVSVVPVCHGFGTSTEDLTFCS